MTKSGWPLVGDARRRVADLIEGLDDEQLASPSLCSGWTCHQAAAHLLTFTHVGVPSFRFLKEMFKARFDYDTASDRLARQLAEAHSAAEIAEMLRDRAEKPNFSKSFPPEMTLTDATIHLQDIRRPLGLGTDLEPNVIVDVLTWMTTHKQAKAVVPPGRTDGLRFSVDDADWEFGDGLVVHGPGEAMIMALGGRDTHSELDGEGAATLRERCGY